MSATVLFNLRLLDFDLDFGLDNQQDMLNDHDLCFICVEKFWMHNEEGDNHNEENDEERLEMINEKLPAK